MADMTTAALLGNLIKEKYIKRAGTTEYLIMADLAHEVLLGSSDRFYVLSDMGEGYHGQRVLAVRPENFYGGYYHRPFEIELQGDARTFAVLTTLDDIQLPIMLTHTEVMALISLIEGDVFPEPLDTKTLGGVTSAHLNRFQSDKS